MNAEVDTSMRLKVKEGETVDFVVGCRESADCDDFQWAPVLTLSRRQETDRRSGSFSAQEDFVGPNGSVPPLTPWVKMTHAMLQSNEFMFVE